MSWLERLCFHAGWWWAAVRRWRQEGGCWLRGGHVDMAHFGTNHLQLRCSECGRLTEGWKL